MKNFLAEKLLLDTLHGLDCTLEVCTAGDPDKDTLIYKGSCGDCLRKIATHELAFTGDEYFCLYTNQGSYDGIDLETICYRMGYSPEEIYEMLKLNDSQELSILSMEECLDKAYGETMVQYIAGDLISFAFSKVPIQEALMEPEKVISEVQEYRNTLLSQPTWSDLSLMLQDVILEEPFDMFFIENDDDSWTKDAAEVLWEEVQAMGIDGAVRCGEDDALVTVYAGAMSCIDWTGHKDYGKPFFEHIFENNVLVSDKKPALTALIQKAEATAVKQPVMQSQERNGDSREF